MLKQSEEKYRIQFDQAMDAVIVADLETGIITDVNQEACKLTGRTKQELIGQHQRILHPPEELTEDAESMSYKQHQQERLGKILESKVITKDGGIKYASIKANPFQLGDRKYMQGIFRDITRQKHLESQLRQFQKMEAIGTLAGGIAHDFNNILFPLIGFAEMLKDDLPADSNLQDNVNEILHAAFRARDLVQQILVFSRKADPEAMPIKLQPILKEAIKLLRASIPTTIDIKQNIGSGCEPVVADPTQIHQIVMNLAINAFHAMEETGGTLTVTLKKVRMESDPSEHFVLIPGEYACLSVSDTGIGMGKEVLARVFDPYFTTKPTGKGTGLGLAMVHGIVKGYGGDIRIYSEPGKGTECRVYIPVIGKKG